jgi:hypothetical protein
MADPVAGRNVVSYKEGWISNLLGRRFLRKPMTLQTKLSYLDSRKQAQQGRTQSG